MWKPSDSPGRSSGTWIIVDQTKNGFSWEDFVGALGGLSKHDVVKCVANLGTGEVTAAGQGGLRQVTWAWNKEEILCKISMIWVIFSQSLQWLLGNDFVARQRSRNGEKGKGTTCILAWSEQSCWTHIGGQTQEMPWPWLFAGSLGVDVAKT